MIRASGPAVAPGAAVRKGDVLVFACGSSLQVFIDALRVDDPESADKIVAQTI